MVYVMGFVVLFRFVMSLLVPTQQLGAADAAYLWVERSVLFPITLHLAFLCFLPRFHDILIFVIFSFKYI